MVIKDKPMTQDKCEMPSSVKEAKAQAKRLHKALKQTAQSPDVGLCQALELTAKMHGRNSWGALKAELENSGQKTDTPRGPVDLTEFPALKTGGILAIEGNPGTGKTRLASEICASVKGKVMALNCAAVTTSALKQIDCRDSSLIFLDELNSTPIEVLELVLPELFRMAAKYRVPVLLAAQTFDTIGHLLPDHTARFKIQPVFNRS